MELNKSLVYKIRNEKYMYVLTPKDIQNVNIEEQETIIKKFFDTFNITVSNSPPPVQISVPEQEPRPARKMRNDVLEVWSNVKQYLDDEFYANEYWEALKKAGYEYKETTKDAIPYQQTTKLVYQKKIEKISNNPVKWRKIYMKTSEEGIDRTIESLKEGKKVEIGVLR